MFFSPGLQPLGANKTGYKLIFLRLIIRGKFYNTMQYITITFHRLVLCLDLFQQLSSQHLIFLKLLAFHIIVISITSLDRHIGVKNRY